MGQRTRDPRHWRNTCLEDRFWMKVDKGEGDACWVYSGDSHPFKYGRMIVNGQRRYAHRMSWEFANGPIPDGLHVLHRCDNPPCVRPDHLFLGTQSDNAHDMWAKGRGSKPPNSWLTRRIRNLRCDVCGRGFTAPSTGARYCGEECRRVGRAAAGRKRPSRGVA